MNTETLQQPSSPEQQIAVARSGAFRLFVEALQYPDEELMEVIRGGQLADAIRTAFEALDPGLSEGIDWEALKDGGSGDDLGVEYTRLFDVGVSGPPCPLCGGLYTGARMKTMEEAVRFYNFFGLSLSGGPRELPDHLSTELEFLHFLAFQEARALQEGKDPGSFRRAQADFVERHPGRWVPKLRVRVEQQEPMRFFPAVVGALEALLAHTQSALASERGA
jgi:DMSO reductase family type II enzyme chaperone